MKYLFPATKTVYKNNKKYKGQISRAVECGWVVTEKPKLYGSGPRGSYRLGMPKSGGLGINQVWFGIGQYGP
jgi:hypothetical protein